MLRIGLIGAGWVTQHHLLAWQRQAGRARVVAIADPARERADDRARAFGIDRVFGDAAALMESGAVDAVDIAAPREFHAALVRLAADRGLPVLCQKPMAPTLAEARALVTEVAGKTRMMVHENWRFRAYYRQLRQWIDEGRTGPVTQAQMSLLTSGLLPDADGKLPAIERQPFMAQLQRALVMEVLIHHIDTLRYLFGELTLVASRIGKQCTGIVGEDRATLTFETAGGASSGKATIGVLANFCVHGAPAAQSDRLLLIGKRGTARLEGDTLTLEGGGVGRPGGGGGGGDGDGKNRAGPLSLRYDMPACYLDSYAAAIGHFVDALANDTPFETSPEDNLRTLELVEQIYAAG